MIRLLCFFFIVFSHAEFSSAEITGAQDTTFRQAVEDWLQDKDQLALPALSSLANDGNKASQYLLAQIEKTTYFASESGYFKSLPSKKRATLMRAPGGLNGKSWLAVLAANDEELAALLLSFNNPKFEFEQIEKLIKYDEIALAKAQKLRILHSPNHALVEKLNDNGLLGQGEKHLFWNAILGVSSTNKHRQPEVIKAILNDVNAGGLDGILMLTLANRYFSPNNKQSENM